MKPDDFFPDVPPAPPVEPAPATAPPHPRPPARIPPRLTVVEQTYHQPVEGSPTAAASAFSRVLASDEQPYVRRFRVEGADWVAAQSKTCWLESCSMMVIENATPVPPVVPVREGEPPPPAECVLEVAFAVPVPDGLTMHDPEPAPPFAALLVLPGESMRAQPAQLQSVLLRCPRGRARVVLTLIPE